MFRKLKLWFYERRRYRQIMKRIKENFREDERDMKNKVVPACLIVNADELNRLIRENIALRKDLQIAATDGDRECGLCTAWNNGYMSACCEACSGYGSLFEWRGIVPENEPTAEEVEAVRRRLTARRKEE